MISKDQVIKLYIAMFQRAPSESEVDYWYKTAEQNNLDTIGLANTMVKAAKDATNMFGLEDLYPQYANYNPNNPNSIKEIINSVYQTLFNKDESQDPAGVNYWTDEIVKDGKSLGEVIGALENAAEDIAAHPEKYADKFDPKTLEEAVNAAKAFEAKVDAAKEIATEIKNVKTDPQSLEELKNIIKEIKHKNDIDKMKEQINSLKEKVEVSNKKVIDGASTGHVLNIKQNMDLSNSKLENINTINLYANATINASDIANLSKENKGNININFLSNGATLTISGINKLNSESASNLLSVLNSNFSLGNNVQYGIIQTEKINGVNYKTEVINKNGKAVLMNVSSEDNGVNQDIKAAFNDHNLMADVHGMCNLKGSEGDDLIIGVKSDIKGENGDDIILVPSGANRTTFEDPQEGDKVYVFKDAQVVLKTDNNIDAAKIVSKNSNGMIEIVGNDNDNILKAPNTKGNFINFIPHKGNDTIILGNQKSEIEFDLTKGDKNIVENFNLNDVFGISSPKEKIIINNNPLYEQVMQKLDVSKDSIVLDKGFNIIYDSKNNLYPKNLTSNEVANFLNKIGAKANKNDKFYIMISDGNNSAVFYVDNNNDNHVSSDELYKNIEFKNFNNLSSITENNLEKFNKLNIQQVNNNDGVTINANNNKKDIIITGDGNDIIINPDRYDAINAKGGIDTLKITSINNSYLSKLSSPTGNHLLNSDMHLEKILFDINDDYPVAFIAPDELTNQKNGKGEHLTIENQGNNIEVNIQLDDQNNQVNLSNIKLVNPNKIQFNINGSANFNKIVGSDTKDIISIENSGIVEGRGGNDEIHLILPDKYYTSDNDGNFVLKQPIHSPDFTLVFSSPDINGTDTIDSELLPKLDFSNIPDITGIINFGNDNTQALGIIDGKWLYNNDIENSNGNIDVKSKIAVIMVDDYSKFDSKEQISNLFAKSKDEHKLDLGTDKGNSNIIILENEKGIGGSIWYVSEEDGKEGISNDDNIIELAKFDMTYFPSNFNFNIEDHILYY